MRFGGNQYEFFLRAVRGSLVPQAEEPAPDCWNYAVKITKTQIALLPPPFSAVFLALLMFMLPIFKFTPVSCRPKLLGIWRKLPGFSAILLFHEKIVSAAELEFQEAHPGSAGK